FAGRSSRKVTHPISYESVDGFFRSMGHRPGRLRLTPYELGPSDGINELRLVSQIIPGNRREPAPKAHPLKGGSTPKSRTVVKGLRTSDPAWRVFAASSGC